MELFLAFSIGTLAGIITGCLPGIGTLSFLLICYPFLLQFDPIPLAICWVCSATISQYFGSVTGILFGIPGENSSLPSVKEGVALTSKNQVKEALLKTALGSFVGGMSCAVLVLLCIPLATHLYQLLTTPVKGFLILIATCSLIAVCDNRWYTNLLLIFAGLTLGKVGYNWGTAETFGTFGFTQLFGGIPVLPLMTALFTFPLLLQSPAKPTSKVAMKIEFKDYWPYTIMMLKHRWQLLRGSAFGFISGFIPGMTYMVGSYLAYSNEKKLEINKKTYETGNMNCLVSSETANNGGAFSQVIPFLILGIPVAASEAFLYNMLEMKGIIVTDKFLFSLLYGVTIAAILCNFLGVIFAGRYANFFANALKLNNKKFYFGIGIFLVIMCMYVGYTQFAFGLYMWVLIILLPFGYLMRKLDTMPLIFAFVMSDRIREVGGQIMASYIL